MRSASESRSPSSSRPLPSSSRRSPTTATSGASSRTSRGGTPRSWSERRSSTSSRSRLRGWPPCRDSAFARPSWSLRRRPRRPTSRPAESPSEWRSRSPCSAHGGSSARRSALPLRSPVCGTSSRCSLSRRSHSSSSRSPATPTRRSTPSPTSGSRSSSSWSRPSLPRSALRAWRDASVISPPGSSRGPRA